MTENLNNENVNEEAINNIFPEDFSLRYNDYFMKNIREVQGRFVVDLYVEVQNVGTTLVGKEIQLGFVGLFINSHFSFLALGSILNEIVSYSVTRDEEKLDTHLRYLQDEFAMMEDIVRRFSSLVESYVGVRSVIFDISNTDKKMTN